MTREEAIQILADLIDSPFLHTWEKQNKALHIAIDALSADVVQGEWILVKGSNGKDYHKCSKCLHTQEITGVKNYCAVCGARMKGDSE